MRNKTTAVLLLVGLLFGGAVGYYIGYNSNLSGSSHITTQSVACDTAPNGSTLYIRITQSDGKNPITNATIDATPVETCNGVDTTIAILYHPVVNASGVATLDASYDTFYNLTAHYRNQSYPFTAFVVNSLATCAHLSIPSGGLTIASC